MHGDFLLLVWGHEPWWEGMRLWVSSLDTLQKEEQQYGAWMCATIERFQVHHVMKNEDYNWETSESHCTCKLDCQTCKESEL